MPLLLHSRCLKPIQISSLGDRNPALLRIDIADCWLRNEYAVWLIITKLGQLVTHSNAILFQLVYGSTIYRCLFISVYQTAVGIISPVEFVNKASHFQDKLWENHDLRFQPVITYIYLCGQIYTSCLSYISNPPSWIGQKLNWNVTKALEKPHTGCVSELGDFKIIMNSKCFHLFSFNTYEHNVYIKEFRLFHFQFNPFNNLTHWIQKSYFLKITSFRWPPFRSRHSVCLLWMSPITLWSIHTGINLTSCRIRCFNSWTVWGIAALKTWDFRYPRERNHMLKDRVTWLAMWCPHIWR